MSISLRISTLLLAVVILLPTISKSQSLRDDINGLFDQVLDLKLAGTQGAHGDHFNPSNVASSQRVINSFSNLLGVSTSSFPITSTSTGLSFEFVDGKAVSTRTSAGPIFGETGLTLGKGALNAGFNFTNFSLTKFRGIETSDLQVNLLHQDIVDPNSGGAVGMGELSTEYDIISIDMNLNVDVNVAAFYAGYGVTDNLDVSVAIPLVSVSIDAAPLATMNSVTFVRTNDAPPRDALHFFGGTASNPILMLRPKPISTTKTGIGDIAFRAKYSFYDQRDLSLAFLGEMKLATGAEEDFLGSGSASYKGMLAGSYRYNNFTPHINLGYDNRTSDLDRDEVELVLGFDHMISPKITLAAEWLGEFEVGDQIDALRFPDPTPIGPIVNGVRLITKTVAPSNLPTFQNEHTTNMSIGLKYSPSSGFLLVGNIIIPTNTAGLRPAAAPTFGLQYAF